MCEPAPGPRCFSDSCEKVTSITRRLSAARAELEESVKVQKTATQKSDFTGFAKAKRRTNTLVARVNKLSTSLRYAQRDADGTKTGARLLEEAMASARTEEEFASLHARQLQASAARAQRVRALECAQNDYVPAIRFDERELQSA